MAAHTRLDREPDEDLLDRIADGETAALEVLFRRRQQNVYRFALHLTGSPSVADDVTQDVFMTVIRGAARYERGRAAVPVWLCGIARNFVRRRLAVDRGSTSIDADEGLEAALPAPSPDPLHDLTSAQAVEALRRAVLTLPLRYREVLVLCDLQESSYLDAAAALDCPVGTVRSRLNRARALLAAKMQADARLQRQRPFAVVQGVKRCLA